MAKYKTEFEKGISTHTLTFREKEFSFSMIPNEYGTKADKPCFSYQISEEFNDLNEDKIDDDTEIDMLDCSDDEDEIFSILERLSKYE